MEQEGMNPENTGEPLRNWAGNFAYHAAHVHQPATVSELQEIVARSSRVKPLGSRHSFNNIADTTGNLIAMDRLDRVLALDRERGTITVEGGVRYGTLCRYLYTEGYGLHNLASLPHISVAGACATATHGSGDRNGCLATAVTALEMVIADGEVVALSRERDPDDFPGVVVGLGALGVVASLTLKIEPAYHVRQVVYENLPLSTVEEHFDDILGSDYSVSLFTEWTDALSVNVWRKMRLADGDSGFTPESTWFGGTRARKKSHMLEDMPSENCTEQGGIHGPWHERLPHFRMEFTPSSGEELQSEYLVPRPHARAALHALRAMRQEIAAVLQVSEIRSIAADDLWMSPFYQQPCVAFHFTWVKDEAAVHALLPRLEAALAPFNARPHWGKLFTTPRERLEALYPRLPDFRALMHRFDPTGKFRNDFLDAALGA